ncbi:MAG: hypothetical protein M3N93_08075 [Acidobacteriota bacterium]|nr:hypothetical protein [Acidobacteriota bacterium]
MRFLRRAAAIDSLALALLVCLLIQPLFRLNYLDNWPSIESTFIADARILGEHLPHTGWQPLWYCGTRADYIYPPALRYGTALISQIANVIPARAYHLYIAIFYVLGILSIYWLARAGSGSRASAVLAALVAAFLSPSYLLVNVLRRDSGFLVPHRLHTLMDYGEGPHIAALAVLCFALAAALAALRKPGHAALACAAALCALVVANNFYGATALAILYPILVWSVWVGDRSNSIWWRAAAIPALAWGLSAFWLTPSYLRITLTDLKWVGGVGNSPGLYLAVGIVFYALFSFAAGSRRPEQIWRMFIFGAAFITGLYVLSFYYFGLQVFGDPRRLVPEMDVFLILCFVETVRTLWQTPRLRVPLALLVIVAFAPAARYVKHLWSPFPSVARLENAYPYQTIAWVHDHLPGARILPEGTVRFWFDVWSDIPQPDGGSEQGMINQNLPGALWQIHQGDRADLSLLWLQALGTDAVIVPAKVSREYYQDYRYPEKFSGALPVLHDDGQGTVIYAVPRVHPGIARVVDSAAIAAVPPLQGGDDRAALLSYIAAIENPAQPAATLQWQGSDAAVLHARTATGQSVLVQETWDPAWHAYENSRELSVRLEDRLGFMLIDAPPGEHDIHMKFETPLENRVGGGVFFITALILAGLIFKSASPGIKALIFPRRHALSRVGRR